MRYAVLVVALMTLWRAPVAAQTPVPGERVRITAPDDGLHRYTGVLVRFDGDAIAVDSLTIARDHVTRVEVYRGRKGHAGAGALWGGLIGGALLGAGGAAMCGDSFFNCDPGTAFAGGFLIGGLTGALLGAGIGALIRTDRWQTYPMSASGPRATVSARGATLGWSIGF